MNILIDYTQIPLQRVGVGVYAYNLILQMTKLDFDNHYFLLVQDDDSSFDGITTGNATLIKVCSRWFRTLSFRFVLEQCYIPYIALKHKINVIHSLHYSFPVITSAKRIVTVCDMIFYKFPELHVVAKVYYFRLFIWLTSLLADKIICISESTKIDYVDKFPDAKSKAIVIALGKSSDFKPDVASTKIDLLKSKYGITKEYLLFIGTIEPRKNISSIIKAYNNLIQDGFDYQLVIVGKKGWHYNAVFEEVEKLGLIDHVIFTGFVDEAEKPIFLAGAKAFVYPSIYEGFGIPVLEALACGTPTITSNISSMPEVAGNAAILVNPADYNDIYRAFTKILSDCCYCQEMKTMGVIQADNFSWEKTAIQTINAYASLN